jgi:DNA modification methylase
MLLSRSRMAQRSGVGEIEAGADREEGMVSTPSGVDALPIKEQLQLFSSLNGKTHKPHALSKRQRLSALLAGELNFHGEDSGYASHDVHAFAAKFPPQLPRAFIRGLSAPGDLVLDPMMGSGTTIVEALLEGRRGSGLDIDPLALRVSHAKTIPMSADDLRDIGLKVISQAQDLLSNKSIERLIQKFDSRPHLDQEKNPKNALAQFSLRLQKNIKSMGQLETQSAIAAPLPGDARAMPLKNEVIDLIVTSPPYANAIDYMRAHKFPLVWLGESVVNLTELHARYIGSEKINGAQYAGLPDKTESIIRQLEKHDRKKSSILRKYFTEMQVVLAEMYRVLRKDSPAIVVVGPSIMRGIDVQTHHCLAEIAQETGFDVIGVVQRSLDRNKRMMPARFGKKTDSMIEQRMHEEYVVGLLKPA